jgi:hypothetical protein
MDGKSCSKYAFILPVNASLSSDGTLLRLHVIASSQGATITDVTPELSAALARLVSSSMLTPTQVRSRYEMGRGGPRHSIGGIQYLLTMEALHVCQACPKEY